LELLFHFASKSPLITSIDFSLFVKRPYHTMFKPQLLRSAARVALPAVKPRASILHHSGGRIACNTFSTKSALYEDKKTHTDAEIDAATTSGEPGESGDHEGQYARTDKSVRVEYPEVEDFPPSGPVQGRGGLHFKKTLASFSLEGRTAVVTGGARGLGLVMAQALAQSGANVALVDLNRESFPS
jgi:D-arabinitol 2-dehydrogenase